MPSTALQHFLQQQRLPPSYLVQAEQHFAVVIDALLSDLQQKRPVILGINGSQGSGKSTLAAYLQTVLQSQHQLQVVSISLDDFYLPKAEREKLARQIHPLFATRGVPGTHDIPLALATLDSLKQDKNTAIPRFNKATDDRKPQSEWDRTQHPTDVIILEGWCLGAAPQTETTLAQPVNALEAEEDSQGIWRRQINQQLAHDYPPLFNQIDRWLMLKAPSFDCIYQWRLEQEEKLAKKLLQQDKKQPAGLMTAAQIQRFVMYFQRLTEHILQTLPSQVDHLYQLDATRQIIDEIHRGN